MSRSAWSLGKIGQGNETAIATLKDIFSGTPKFSGGGGVLVGGIYLGECGITSSCHCEAAGRRVNSLGNRLSQPKQSLVLVSTAARLPRGA